MFEDGAIALSGRHEQLKRLRRLVRQPKVRSSERAFVVDGPTLVADAVAAQLTIESVFVGTKQGFEPLREAMAARHLTTFGTETSIFEVEDRVLMPNLDPRNPVPVAAVVRSPTWSLSDLAKDRAVLVAVELRDPGNLGTIMRTAEAAGCAGVIVLGQSVDPLNPKVVRASAGSLFRLPVCSQIDVEQGLHELRSVGRSLVATVVDPKAASYDQADLTAAALLVGNEPRGLDTSLIGAADQVVTIPMAQGIESLNVAAAAAVIAFEAARQRRAVDVTGEMTG